MSKTPETDAEVSGVRPWVIDDNRLASWTDYECLRDFARRMERERNTALAALAEYREDAERYRWLRDNRIEAQAMFWNYESRKQRDAAIDAAREGNKEPAQPSKPGGYCCPDCDGRGWCEGSPAFACATCNGTGMTPNPWGLCMWCPPLAHKEATTRCLQCPRRKEGK